MGNHKKLDNKQNFYVRDFSGSKVNCMNDYVKPCIRESKPGHIIFHVGTNDLPSDKDPNSTAHSISTTFYIYKRLFKRS